jgi:hypothetical protein
VAGKKIKVVVKLFTCGKCRKGYNNPLTHVCKVSFTRAGQKKIGGIKQRKKK